MSNNEWSDQKNAAIVADYFDMLDLEFAGRTFTKAERNRALQSQIGRARGSIEYKHQNISAILKDLGKTWIDGYKPALITSGRCRKRSFVGSMSIRNGWLDLLGYRHPDHRVEWDGLPLGWASDALKPS